MIFGSGKGGTGKNTRIRELLHRSVAVDHVANVVKDALVRIGQVERAETQAESLSDMTDNLGEVHSGAWVASEGDPEDTGFSGTVIAWPAVTINGNTYTLYGMNNGDLQFGLDALTGRAMAGGGRVVLDDSGARFYGDTAGNSVLNFYQDTDNWNDANVGRLLGYYDGVNSAWMKLSSYRLSPAWDPEPWTLASTVVEALNYQRNFRATQLTLSSDDLVTLYAHLAYLYLYHPTQTETMTASASSGGSVDAGSHSYIVTFVDAHGETPIDTDYAVSVTTGSPNYTVNLSGIQLGQAGCTARKIYRTKGGGNEYFLLTTINDNTTTTYTDTTADASLGVTPPEHNTSGGLRVIGKIMNEGYQIVTPSAYHWRPPAVTASSPADATGNVTAGYHWYRIAFVDSNGKETKASPATVAYADASHTKVNLTIPTGAGNVYGRWLYRSQAGVTSSTVTTWKRLAWIGENTSTTYTDNIADGAEYGSNLPRDEGNMMMPTFPRRDFWLFKDMNGTALVDAADTACQMAFYSWQGTGNAVDGDKWTRSLWLDVGDYHLVIVGVTNTGHSILDGYMNGTAFFTGSDWYSGAITRNVSRTYDFTVTEPGYQWLELRVNGKNASSSNYYQRLNYMYVYTDTD